MTKTIPTTAIQLAYLWPCNAAQAAFSLSQSYGVKLSIQDLDLRWDSECVNHPLLHELGTRPEMGFRQSSEHVKLATKIIEDEHNACAEL